MLMCVILISLPAHILAYTIIGTPILSVVTPGPVTYEQQVNLLCSTPTPGVTYEFFTTATIKTSSVPTYRTGVFVIPSFGYRNEGKYTCRVSNPDLLATRANSSSLFVRVGTPGGTRTGSSAGQLKISLLILTLGTLLATSIF